MAQRRQVPAVSMSHPDEWLALLRIVVGLYFVKSLVTKMTIVLAGGIVPLPAVSERWLGVMPKIVARQASENPLSFYKHFLEGTVIPHSSTFAQLTAWGETVAGLGLTLGLLVGMAAALWLMGVRRPGLLAAIAFAVAFAAYGLFILALDARFPHGPVEKAIAAARGKGP